MDVIDQRLMVKEWPLKNVGDEKFFGYVVALGVFPRAWDSEGLIPFVDFAFDNNYSRYRLPKDRALTQQLREFLAGNLDAVEQDFDIAGKVWIALTPDGYRVTLP